MSSSTPNIGLTLPVGGENVSRQIINENNTKIDNYAGTLNSKLLKPITVTVDPITNASGSYNHTTSGLTLITEDMKAIDIEVGTPETFKAPVTVTTGNHTVNVSCPSVSGSSTITITFIHTEPVDGGQNVPSQITSAEFDILAGRIGNLSSLQTSVKTDTVSAINSLSEQIATLNNNINQRLIFRCEYIEIQFTNGHGEYDLSAILSAIGKTNANSPITSISGSASASAPCVRASDMANDKHTLMVGLTTNYSGTVGCFVLFYAT